MDDAVVKLCPVCKKLYPATHDFFYKSTRHSDNFQSYCKKCDNSRRRLRESKHLRKNREGKSCIIDENFSNPLQPVLGSTNECGSCKSKTNNIFGDVNNATQEKYGYLCGKCYKLAKIAQGDRRRMQKVLNYLELTRGNQVQ